MGGEAPHHQQLKEAFPTPGLEDKTEPNESWWRARSSQYTRTMPVLEGPGERCLNFYPPKASLQMVLPVTKPIDATQQGSVGDCQSQPGKHRDGKQRWWGQSVGTIK